MLRYLAALVIVAGACNEIVGLDALEFGAAASVASSGSGGTSTASTAASGGMSASSTSGVGAGGGNADWWKLAWPQRAPLTITNVSADALADGYEARLELDVGATFGNATSESLHMARFTMTDGWTDVATFVEQMNGLTYVWFPLTGTVAPNDTAEGYWLYAGNPSPPPADDPAAVFTVWDAFDDPMLPLWAKTGTPDASSGVLELDAGDAVRMLSSYGPGHAVDARMAIHTPVSSQWVAAGWQTANDGEPWILWISRGAFPAEIRGEVEIAALNVFFDGLPVGLVIDEPHLYGVERHADHIVFRHDNVVQDQASLGNVYGDPEQVRLVAKDTSSAGFEYVRVRQCVDPPPTVTLGAVETL